MAKNKSKDNGKSGSQDFEVDVLLARRKSNVKSKSKSNVAGAWEYLVRWAPPYQVAAHDTWEPQHGLGGCEHLMKRWAAEHPSDGLVGRRASRDFDGVWYEGVVARRHMLGGHMHGPLWRVVYDDGDAEDMDKSGATAAVRHYTRLQQVAKAPKASKKAPRKASKKATPKAAPLPTRRPHARARAQRAGTPLKAEAAPSPSTETCAPCRTNQRPVAPSGPVVKSAYELEREAKIAQNLAMLKSLGLDGPIGRIVGPAKKQAKPKHKRRLESELSFGPRRASARIKDGPLSPTDRDEEGDDTEQEYKRARVHYIEHRDYGQARSEKDWNLVRVYDARGQEERRRRSCHVCTQCVASWRGAFSTPLGCTTCPLIYCSRCLLNIYGDVEGIEAVITAANKRGRWQCFKCQDTCACQAPELKRLSPMDRHKTWGWVGVTGNRDPSCSKPTIKSLDVAVDGSAEAAVEVEVAA